MALSAKGDTQGARSKQMAVQPQIAQADKAISEHRDYNMQLAREGGERAARIRDQAVLTASLLALLATGALLTIGTLLIRRLVRALHAAVDLANRVAEGDLTTRVNATGNDEVGQLQRALSHMSDKLTNVIAEVQNGAHAIQIASNEIASGNMDLSSRTEQQAGALEETASSMEELNSTVLHNADNTLQARQMAQDAAQKAVAGGQVVRQVVEKM